jgi:hypothetical protein
MVTTVQKSQEFTASGNYTVPAGVQGVWLTMIGGGSGGGCSYQGQNSNGARGGASGELLVRFPIKVTPGAVIPVVIGAGGPKAKTIVQFAGTPGGTTSFGNTLALGARAPVSTTTNFGGGPGGGIGAAGAADNGGIGHYGLMETPIHMGGIGGSVGGQGFGSVGVGQTPGFPGSGAPGYVGGAGGAPTSGIAGGGAGGASTLWGLGGDGGLGGSQGTSTGGNPPAGNGHDVLPGAYGAGGGGAGGCTSAFSGQTVWGGAGGPGYCLVEWYEEVP